MDGGGDLFADVKFFIAECDRSDEVRESLVNGGARHVNYLTESVTHVIADRVCSAAVEALDLFDKPVVKSAWVRTSLRTKKLWPPEAFSPFNTTFNNIVAYFSTDLSLKDIRDLQALVTANGGRLTNHLIAATHFITPTTKPSEFQDNQRIEGRFKIVAPDWVLDSFAAKKSCDETLYDPKLLLSPPPPPPPKQPTPPPVVKSPPQQRQPSQAQQQQQMIDSNEARGPLHGDSSSTGQQPRPTLVQANEKQIRKSDNPEHTHSQTPMQSATQSRQVNPMPPMTQAQPTRAPTIMPNVIRGASPRYRQMMQPVIPRPQPANRIVATDQIRRPPVDFNQAYRKPGPPYPYNPEIHVPQQHSQLHQQSQMPPYQQVEMPSPQHHGPPMNPTMRQGSPGVYHPIRPGYQNTQMPPRMPMTHPNAMHSQQQHQPVQRFQDTTNHLPQTGSYQMGGPHQQIQVVNSGYQQGNIQRHQQPIYYNQNPNNPMRPHQPGPMMRPASDQMMANESHHRFPNQYPPQQPPVYQQQQLVQRNQIHIQRPQPFQPPHPPAVTPNQAQPQLLPNMPNSTTPRSQRAPITANQADNKYSNTRQTTPTQNMDKPPRLTKIPVSQQLAHPSIFDSKQPTNYAQMKAKVPVLADNVKYHNYPPDVTIPSDRPLFGCKFQFIEHDDMSQKVRQCYCDAIIAAGGVFEENLDNLTHLICESQSSPIFSTAVKKGVRCVTTYWINDILGQGRLEFPWKALHIPTLYSKEDKHLRNQIISITNLRKQEREYIKIMIKKTGAKFTDYFSRKNTLLICGKPEGEKFERAIEWGIPVANCLLISDYLISGRNFEQMLEHAKYQNFNRGEQLKLDSYDLIRNLMVPWTKPIPVALDTLIVNGVAKNSPPEKSSETNEVLPVVANTDSASVARSPVNQSETNVTNKSKDAQNDLSSTNAQNPDSNVSNPAAKDSATETTNGIDKSNQLSSSNLDKGGSLEQGSKVNDMTIRHQKVRTSTAPVRVLFTRFKPELEAKLEKIAIELGFKMASCPVECTHLIVERISRSPRFICSFNHADFVLSYNWLIDSHQFGKPLSEIPYILQDKEGEKKFCFNLAHSLMKRKRRNHLLFRDYTFFVTPSPLRLVVSLRDIIRSAGAMVEVRKLPSEDQISHLRREGKRFVVVASPDDLYLLEPLEKYTIDIVDYEFVLSGILRQDIDFEHHRLNRPSNNIQKGFNSVQPSPAKRIRQS